MNVLLLQEQRSFREGSPCTDHVFVLPQILKQSHEWNSLLYVVFIDFEKTFDSLHYMLLSRRSCDTTTLFRNLSSSFSPCMRTVSVVSLIKTSDRTIQSGHRSETRQHNVTDPFLLSNQMAHAKHHPEKAKGNPVGIAN